MLTHCDPSSGETLSEEHIIDNTLVFLIAGSETTSSLISFCLFRISTLPEVEAKIQAELREVGITSETEHLTVEQIKQLKYLDQVIYETLRLHSPVPVYAKWCTEDAIVTSNSAPGKAFKIKANSFVSLAIDALHHNPRYWDDPERFDPDRFLPENMARRHSHAWMPFSGGMRGCIGRQFSMQETRVSLSPAATTPRSLHSPLSSILLLQIFLAILMARFSFRPRKPEKVSYSATSGLTSQPTNLFMQISRKKSPPTRSSSGSGSPEGDLGSSIGLSPLGRTDSIFSSIKGERRPSIATSLGDLSTFSEQLASSSPSSLNGQGSELLRGSRSKSGKSLPYVRVVFGSNAGAAEDFGHELDSVLQELGFESKVSSLDYFLASKELAGLRGKSQEAKEACDVPLVVFVTSTYNNLAPDNAAQFDKYLTGSRGDKTEWEGM